MKVRVFFFLFIRMLKILRDLGRVTLLEYSNRNHWLKKQGKNDFQFRSYNFEMKIALARKKNDLRKRHHKEEKYNFTRTDDYRLKKKEI